MRLTTATPLIIALTLSGCLYKGNNPQDPYEYSNREVYKFNRAFDATMIKPPTRLYRAVVPQPLRKGISNAYDNISMIPTIANDILQLDLHYFLRDSWRFMINSTFGIAGLFDVADSNFKLPPHRNDFGLTFAKWGYKQSTYVVLPFIGPSTIRDGGGMLVDCTLFSPYAYLAASFTVLAVSSVRYLDLRSQLMETESYINQSLDEYTFVRDAYLQHRHFCVTGEQEISDSDSLYVDSEEEDKR